MNRTVSLFVAGILGVILAVVFTACAMAGESRKRLQWEDEFFINATYYYVRTPFGKLECQGNYWNGPKSFKGIAAGEIVVNYSDEKSLEGCLDAVTDYYFKELRGKVPVK